MTLQVLDEQREAFEVLAQPATWDADRLEVFGGGDGGIDRMMALVTRMFRAALVCANASQHGPAVRLLMIASDTYRAAAAVAAEQDILALRRDSEGLRDYRPNDQPAAGRCEKRRIGGERFTGADRPPPSAFF